MSFLSSRTSRRLLVASVTLLVVAATGAAAAKADKEKAGAGTDANANGKAAKDKNPHGPPKLDARAWIVIDARDGTALASSDPDRELPIASTTKLMTAFLALNHLKPKQKLTAPAYDAVPNESLLGLQRGEKVSVRDLLYALVLVSANDAAETFAVGVSGSEKGFVKLMNRSAGKLGLEHTHYANPIGLDSPQNYSSARDLVTLADDLLTNPLFAKIADSEKATLETGAKKRRIHTLNTLLPRSGFVTGVKTGHTNDARYVLVGSGRRYGTTLIAAVLGAGSEKARDNDTLELLNYGFSQFRHETVVRNGEHFTEVPIEYRRGDLDLVAAHAITVALRGKQPVRTVVHAPEEVDGPIERGDRIGRVSVLVQNRPAGSAPLLAANRVSEPDRFDTALFYATEPKGLAAMGVLAILIALLAVWGWRRGSREPYEPEPAPEQEWPGQEEPGESQEPQEKKTRRFSKLGIPFAKLRRRDRRRARTVEDRRTMHEERLRRRKKRGAGE